MMPVETPKKSGVIAPRALTWQRRLAVWAVLAFMRGCMKSWRVHWKDGDLCPGLPGPVIYCLWHNRLAMAMKMYDNFVREKWPAAGLCAVISASRDGTFLASLFEPFGVTPIRGSSSRRGAQAVLEATTRMEKNYSVAWTPDGPRGPAYKAQEGIIQLAQLSGRPIIPLSNYVRFKVCRPSWDRFQIPLPFARCELRYGKPFWVPRDTGREAYPQLCRDLEKAMMEITRD